MVEGGGRLNSHSMSGVIAFLRGVVVVAVYFYRILISLPDSGKVGKNWSARSKTTVRNKGDFPFKVRGGSLHCVTQFCMFLFFPVWSFWYIGKGVFLGGGVPHLIIHFLLFPCLTFFLCLFLPFICKY